MNFFCSGKIESKVPLTWVLVAAPSALLLEIHNLCFLKKILKHWLSNLLINLILSFLHFNEDVGESVGKQILFTDS